MSSLFSACRVLPLQYHSTQNFLFCYKFFVKSWQSLLIMLILLNIIWSKLLSGSKKLDDEDKLKKALLKKALGYSADEVVCEYVLDEDGSEKLSKKKITKKHYAPDITAMKMLLDKANDNDDIALMSDEQLLQERKRLLQLLKEEDKD